MPSNQPTAAPPKKLPEFNRNREPLEKDQDGNEINPYIPYFISKVPWYLNQDGTANKDTVVGKDGDADYLSHQRKANREKDGKSSLYDDVQNEKKDKELDTMVIKFKKGSCKNCGSMSHKEKDCLERPRKLGVKYSKLHMKSSSSSQASSSTAGYTAEYAKGKKTRNNWDEKRDMWEGWDSEMYNGVLKKYEEKEKKEKEEQELADREVALVGPVGPVGPLKPGKKDEELDEAIINMTFGGGLRSSATKSVIEASAGSGGNNSTSMRNREDTALYLRDLSEDAPVYNPKSKVLMDESMGYIDDKGLFRRNLSGAALEYEKLNEQVEKAMDQGIGMHLQANPTESAQLIKRLARDEQERVEKKRKELTAKYGDVEQASGNPKRMRRELTVKPVTGVDPDRLDETRSTTVNSHNVESKMAPARATSSHSDSSASKYEEDVHVGNHSSVWGSYWKDGAWGYACCQSLDKRSYCMKV
ncbi:hypothetical protein NADFUDRAFT_81328 [Nadsonia fulvescens var. elongata DSM 6958]|uniref:Pre-mRNA-splicing factor SLU7 n=1 Tax=Nadsonia fulvescens var. elongata DSM 6958 TaxID=857566 RepID=A0A1E3PTS0_9ASCO|nr:hypothetical protein NADFUDRAFT_81328 [Nadsonia fulvescens var. elongata DSM 6958]